MPSSKEIEIILQAKLEQGNAVDSAKELGKGISEAIERAFDGLGERIASGLILQMRNTISNIKLGDMFNTNNTEVSQKLNRDALPPPGGTIYGPDNRPVYFEPPRQAPIGAPGTDVPGGAYATQLSSASLPANTAAAAEAAGQSDFKMRLGGVRYGLGLSKAFLDPANPLDAELRKISQEEGGGVQESERQERLRMDAIATRLRSFKNLRRVDPSAQVDDSFREELFGEKGFRNFAVDQIKGNDSKIQELTSAIQHLTEETKKNATAYEEANKKATTDRTPEEQNLVSNFQKEQARRYAKIRQSADDIERIQEESSSLGRSVNDVDAIRNDEMSRMAQAGMLRRQKILGFSGLASAGVAAVATGVRAYNDYSLLQANRAAATAELENMGVRDALSGNYDRVLATELAGGEDKIRSESLREAKVQAFTNLGSGLAQIGLGTVSAIYGGPMGMVAGGLTALHGASTLSDSWREFQNEEAVALERANQKISDSGVVNKEKIMANRVAREKSIGSYLNSQAMGAPELSGDLMGLQSTLYAGGTSARDRAVGYGLTNESFDAFQANMLSSMGGTFLNAAANPLGPSFDVGRFPMRSYAVQEQLDRGMKLKAGGFSNYEAVTGSMFEQNVKAGLDPGADRASAAKEGADLYQRAFDAGIDKSKIPQYLEQIVSRMNARGYGAAYDQKLNMDRSLAIANATFGEKVEGKQIKAVQDVVDTVSERYKSTTDPVATKASADLINKLTREFPAIAKDIKSSDYSDYFMRTMPGSPEEFVTYLNRTRKEAGRKPLNEEETKQATGLYTKYTEQSPKQFLDLLAASLGPTTNNNVLARELGARTFQQMETGASVIERIRAGDKDPELVKAFNKLREGRVSDVPTLGNVPGKDDSTLNEQAKLALITRGAAGLAGSFDVLKTAVDGLIKKLNEGDHSFRANNNYDPNVSNSSYAGSNLKSGQKINYNSIPTIGTNASSGTGQTAKTTTVPKGSAPSGKK